MHKDKANRYLDDVKEQIKGSIWLLDKCTHGYESHAYPHHVRDRITESLIAELHKLIGTIERVQTAIDRGLENEGKEDETPF